jgi:hypothetical protein
MATNYKDHRRPNRQTHERVLVFDQVHLVLARIKFSLIDAICAPINTSVKDLALKKVFQKIKEVKDLIERLYSTDISEFSESDFLTWIIPDNKENSRKLKSMNRKVMFETDRALGFLGRQFQGGSL